MASQTLKHINKLLFALLASTLLYFLLVTGVFAQTDCQPLFGGGQVCGQNGQVSVDMTVKRQNITTFVNNLGTNDPRFAPNQQVTFRIVVKNNDDQTSRNMIIKNTFPQYITYKGGPGAFDAKTRALTIEAEPLRANEARTYTITGVVAQANRLPQNTRVLCVMNQSSVVSNNQTSTDNAQFCIERPEENTAPATTKGGKPIFPAPNATNTPKTGPEMLGVVSLVSSGLLGFWLKKRTKTHPNN